MKKRLLALLLILSLGLAGCSTNKGGNANNNNNIINNNPPEGNRPQGGKPSDDSSFTDDNSSYGEDIKDGGAYDGFFEEDLKAFKVKCESGTPACYKLENNVLTFTAINTETVYAITGKFTGRIVIDVGNEYKFDLELVDFSLVSEDGPAITVLSGNEVSIQAKKGTKSYIYDTRAAISDDDETAIKSAIHSEVDMELAGKGSLVIISENNNGVHSKKDLQVKNLTLMVSCKDNSLKGNDSVSLENATATIISTTGDAIKTTNSDISNKENQRGTISFLGGSYDVYAAADGVDAAYDVVVESETILNIFTDKYSNYSEEVATVSGNYYVRFNRTTQKYSVKYYNSDTDFVWVNAEYHSSVPSGRGGSYFFYSFPKMADYSKLQLFVYSETMEQGQDTEYLYKSDLITPSQAYDTITLRTGGSSYSCDWTNYATSDRPTGGPGGGFGPGMEGNTEKGDHSAKGIKAANVININGGDISIKSYDDAIHANNDDALENGVAAKGDVNIKGGNVVVYSNDDGLHADGKLTILGGNVSVLHSYEGAEGTTVSIRGGNVSIISKDDGINATATSGTSISIAGGTLYILAGGDGIDSNSSSSYLGIAFTGGNSLIISTSGGNSAIDSEKGYSYTAGNVVALMPRGAMTDEAVRCQNFSSVGKSTSCNASSGQYLNVDFGGVSLTVNMPVSISGTAVILGSASATLSVTSATGSLSEGEFSWITK